MGAEHPIDWQAAAASAIDWWIEVGVDTQIGEEPRHWLKAAEAVVASPRAMATVAPAAPVQAPLPASLADFLAWRGGPDAPDAGWPGAAIASQGPVEAGLMVLVDLPDREDCEGGSLLSGAPGRLFDRMLAAIGRDRNSIHLAAICTRRPAAGRIAPEVEEELFRLARHHVALARPKRLLLMGNAPSRALLATDFASARGTLHPVNQEGSTVGTPIEAVATFHPRYLIERPAMKAQAWKDLQMLMKGLAA